jgi:hypothetical protein
LINETSCAVLQNNAPASHQTSSPASFILCLQLDSDLLVAASVLTRLIWDRWLSTNWRRASGNIPTINTTLWLAVVLVGMKLLAHLQEAQEIGEHLLLPLRIMPLFLPHLHLRHSNRATRKAPQTVLLPPQLLSQPPNREYKNLLACKASARMMATNIHLLVLST